MTVGSAPRHLLADRGGDRVLDRAHAVERQRAADRDGQIDEGFFADGAGAHLLDRDHARHFRGDGGDLLGGALRRRVGERVDGAPSEPPAGDADQHRDHQRGGGIRPTKAEPHAAQADQHRQRGPQIGRKMQRVGFQRLAPRLFGGARQRARAEEIDHDRHRDHAERPGIRDHHVLFVLGQALDRFPDHHAREQEQQRRFRQRRNALDLAVAVMVFLVGRLAGNAHGGIGHHRGAEIDQRMAGFRQNRERAGGKADHALGDRQHGRGRDRG